MFPPPPKKKNHNQTNEAKQIKIAWANMWNLGLDEAKNCWVQAQFINTMQADVKELVWYNRVMTTRDFWERYY